jgi:hypothetical protein
MRVKYRRSLTKCAELANLERTKCGALDWQYHYSESRGNAMMKRLMMGCAVMLATHAAIGQVMECVDAKGNKSIAQFCPPGTVKENQLMKGGTSTSSSGAATGSKSLAERDAEFKKRNVERQEADAKAEKGKSESKDAERNCDSARAQMKQLQDGQRISRIDPNTGERSFLDDRDRPAEIERAQTAVDNWCKKR